MITNFTSFLSDMDKNSQFLLIIIFVIVFLLILIFIINSINSRKAKKFLEKQNAYKRKLREEIDLEAKNIITEEKKTNIKAPQKVIDEEIEVLDDSRDDIDEILDDLKAGASTPGFNLTDFEREQEETAIISYDELCKKHGVEKKIYTKNEEAVIEKVNNIVENKNEEHKFKPTRYVSPIFGLEQQEAKEQAFLTNLKEFRSGLE